VTLTFWTWSDVIHGESCVQLFHHAWRPTWPVSRGSDIITYLESPTPICLCNFYGAPTTIKGLLLWSRLMLKPLIAKISCGDLVTFTFDLLTFNSWRTWRVTWPTVPPSLKTRRLFVHELRVIKVPIGYHWKCLRGHWACAESRDPCVPRRTANTMTYCPTWHAGIIINKSGKFEDIVLMIAKRQAYRHRDGDIIQACNRIVFCQRRC